MTSDQLTSTMVDDFNSLRHFGVKGMHWGVRKGRASGQAHEDAAAAINASKKVKEGGGTHVLSNAELKVLVDRLNLEQQHARLTASETTKSKVKKGQSFVNDIVGIGKTGVDAYETGKKIHKIAKEVKK